MRGCDVILQHLKPRRQVLDLAPIGFGARGLRHAVQELGQHDRRGRQRVGFAVEFVPHYDVLIAGHARSRGLIVVTSNRSEFDRVDGLRCEDWR